MSNIQILTAFLLALLVMPSALAQNIYQEEIPFEIVDGLFVINASAKGEPLRLAFDPTLQSSTAILTTKAGSLGVIPGFYSEVPSHPRGGIVTTGAGELSGLTIGTYVYHPRNLVLLIENALLESNGIDGIAGPDLFTDHVLSIDKKNGRLIISYPYKPPYVQLRNRGDMNRPNLLTIQTDEGPVEAGFDIYGDYYYLKGRVGDDQVDSNFPVWFHKVNQVAVGSITVGKKEFRDIAVTEDADLSVNLIGTKILDEGILTIDYQKRKYYYEPYETLDSSAGGNTLKPVSKSPLTELDLPMFLDRIYNYRENEELKFEGDKPAIIDFWAEWCVPCRQLTPILEELAGKYSGKIDFYKLNIDEVREVSRLFGIISIPLLWYIPVDGEPVKIMGLRPMEEIEKNIREVLRVE